MSRSQFHLELYEPGSTSVVLGCWPCVAPMHMAVGDVVRTGVIDDDALPSTRLRVERVEHVLHLSADGFIKHKLMVFTAPG